MSHPADSFSKDEGYYASMADLMAGMLFIFIIIAMVFALDVRKDRVDAVAEAEAKAEARVKAELDVPATPLDRPSPVDTEIAVRARLIETIRDFLASRGIQVESAPREGLLRLPAGQYFAAKGASLLPAGQTMISHLGEALGRWLPCMAAGAPAPDAAACQPFAGVLLRTVRIETHAEPGLQTAAEAESLTGARAVHLLSGLLGAGAPLLDLRNDAAERLLDIRGMGVQWPLEPAPVEPVPAQPVAEPAKPAPPPAKGAAAKKDAGKKEAGKQEAEKSIPAKHDPPQPRSQRIDLRFDMVVPVVEQPGQAGGLILRPTAK
jgi:chemotaxis protein MotB